MRIARLALLATLTLHLPMLADTYTYTYTGKDFTALNNYGIPQVFTTSDFLTIDFTLSAPLADSLPKNTAITPASFTVSDGYQMFTNQNATAGFQVGTDASGQITLWDIYAFTIVDSIEDEDLSELTGPGVFSDHALFNYSFSDGEPDGIFDSAISPEKGSWTVTDNPAPAVTPEPSSLLLFGTGILGLAAAVKRRLAA